MTPETAITCLFDIIASRVEFTEDTVYAAMKEAGVSEPVADRAYKFAQIACGRQLLSGMGNCLAPDYTCFNAAGEAIESGRLAEQRYFAAATVTIGRSVRRHDRLKRFQEFSCSRLSQRPDNALNTDALHATSRHSGRRLAPRLATRTNLPA